MSAPSLAEQRAIAVLERLGISDVPVPVEEIARKLGAKIAFDSFEGEISGMLFRDQDAAVIGVNSRHATTRQRFTVAHEIGHLELHKGQPLFIDRFVRVNWRDGQSSKEEVQANAFAAELLMPRTLVEKELKRVLSRRPEAASQELVAVLAERFAVSPAAMQYRLTNLGVLDAYSLAG